MFISPYSPFFTSGLLSASPSRTSSPEPLLFRRRGSLPTDSRSSNLFSTTDNASNYYCTLQPKRDKQEFRSFLSLDLAESQSMRSLGMKRLSKFASRAETVLFPKHPTILRSPLNASRESLRAIPSPKPAPSISLPNIPSSSTRSSLPFLSSDLPPRLPPITSTLPLRFSSLEDVSHSAPAQLHSTSYLFPSHSRRSSISTSPTWFRAVTREDTLARLEGRATSRRRVQRNFMSMSDDEDDDEFEDEDVDDLPDESQTNCGASDLARVTRLAEILDDEDQDAFFSPAPHSRAASRRTIPTAKSLSIQTRSKLSRRSGKRRTTMTESWFPLASFMDDDSTWNWRSFIEIASVS